MVMDYLIGFLKSCHVTCSTSSTLFTKAFVNRNSIQKLW